MTKINKDGRKRLLDDYARCATKFCPFEGSCFRKTEPTKNAIRVSWFAPTPYLSENKVLKCDY